MPKSKRRQSLPALMTLSPVLNGFDQNVGEGDNLLSVGQKQLIGIARALLAEPIFS